MESLQQIDSIKSATSRSGESGVWVWFVGSHQQKSLHSMWSVCRCCVAAQLQWSRKSESVGHRQVLPGDRHSFTVSDLVPDATYNLQVRCCSDGYRLSFRSALFHADTRTAYVYHTVCSDI